MFSSKTFSGVDEEVFDFIKMTAFKEYHGTVYIPPDGTSGTATTNTPVGPVKLRFLFEPENKRVTYEILEKPWMIPESKIWEAIAEIIQDWCA